MNKNGMINNGSESVCAIYHSNLFNIACSELHLILIKVKVIDHGSSQFRRVKLLKDKRVKVTYFLSYGARIKMFLPLPLQLVLKRLLI